MASSIPSHFFSSPAATLASSSHSSPHYSASQKISHVTAAFLYSSKYVPNTRRSRPVFVHKYGSKESPLPSNELGAFDRLLLTLFRDKMVQEVGWDSKREGYDGLIEVSRHLMTKYKTSPHIEDATVRILKSLFPSFLLPLFRRLIAPLAGGKIAAVLTARVTQATCQWLMGPCKVNDVKLSDGSSLASGSFIKSEMGVSLAMEPNFEDFSCQFKFGVEAPPPQMDEALKVKCLDICPSAAARIRTQTIGSFEQCPEYVYALENSDFFETQITGFPSDFEILQMHTIKSGLKFSTNASWIALVA